MARPEDAHAVALAAQLGSAHKTLARRLIRRVGSDDVGGLLSAIHQAEAVLGRKNFDRNEKRDRQGRWTDAQVNYVTTAAARNTRIVGGARMAAAAAAATADREAIASRPRPPVMGDVWEHGGHQYEVVGLTPDVVKARDQHSRRTREIPRGEFMARYRKVKDASNQDPLGDYGGYFS